MPSIIIDNSNKRPVPLNRTLIFCFVIDYRERHTKGIVIHNASEVYLQQKL
jgi:hypothetical protein